jgi:hypothetical protein
LKSFYIFIINNIILDYIYIFFLKKTYYEGWNPQSATV